MNPAPSPGPGFSSLCQSCSPCFPRVFSWNMFQGSVILINLVRFWKSNKHLWRRHCVNKPVFRCSQNDLRTKLAPDFNPVASESGQLWAAECRSSISEIPHWSKISPGWLPRSKGLTVGAGAQILLTPKLISPSQSCSPSLSQLCSCKFSQINVIPLDLHVAGQVWVADHLASKPIVRLFTQKRVSSKIK